MTLERMKWYVYLLPPILLGGLEVVRQIFFPELFETRWFYAAFLTIAIAGMWCFAYVVVRNVERMQQHLIYQNQELLALHHASLAIASDLKLETVLQRVVDEATLLVGAEYGAISYSRSLPTIDLFITHGVSDMERRAIGAYPTGKGLLGVPIGSGETLRVDNIGEEPRSAGFPPNHPPMRQLLAVPVSTTLGVVGNLYLSDKRDRATFNEADEKSLKRFAALAAIAIENAVLHEQVEVLAISGERERIAREMHDSLAQVLAYVNTKSQAAMAHLSHGKVEQAQDQIEQLAASAREAYVDVREGIFALRSAMIAPDQSVFDSLAGYIERWRDHHGIPVDLSIEGSTGDIGLSPLAEVHLLRLVQEALTNIRKHANASRVTVSIEPGDVQLRLVIRDDGTGFDPGEKTPGSHPRFGLATMRERAEASGGTFEIVSAPGKGTTIEVVLPAGAS